MPEEDLWDQNVAHKILFAHEYHCTIIIRWKILFAHEYPHLNHAHHWCKWPHQYSIVHFQSAAWVASLPLTHLAIQTRSPSGCLTAPSWNSESLRGCGCSCHAPPPSTTQSGCTSRCLRPPSSGYTCEHKCKICLDSMYHNAISTCEWQDCKRVVIPIEAFVTNSSHVQDCHHVPLRGGVRLESLPESLMAILYHSVTRIKIFYWFPVALDHLIVFFWSLDYNSLKVKMISMHTWYTIRESTWSLDQHLRRTFHFEHGCQHFNRRRVSDCPMRIYKNTFMSLLLRPHISYSCVPAHAHLREKRPGQISWTCSQTKWSCLRN